MNRRDMLKAAAVASAYAALPKYSFAAAKGSDKLKVGVIGCSGRGIAAVRDMINADRNVEIVALADLFPDRIDYALSRFESYKNNKTKPLPADCFNVKKEMIFTGWDAYKQLLQTDVDLVIHATPPVFRPMHLKACLEAGKHVFIEKPGAVDAVGARQLYECADLADKKGLSVIGGIQRRFHKGYMEGIERMKAGELGDITSTQAVWLNSKFFIQKMRLQNPDPESMEYQVRNWFIFTWTSGDCYVEQHVHNLDIILWGLDKKPIMVNGLGGRRWDLPVPQMGNRFSHFAVDFDFGNNLHCYSYSRRETGAQEMVQEKFMGTKGTLELSLQRQRIIDNDGKTLWEMPQKDLPQCLEEEHRVLIEAIRSGKQKNMIRELADSTVMAIAGRESAYAGRAFKYDWLLAKSQKNYLPAECKFGKKPVDGIPIPGEYQLS